MEVNSIDTLTLVYKAFRRLGSGLHMPNYAQSHAKSTGRQETAVFYICDCPDLSSSGS